MIHTQDADFTLHHGDCVEVLRTLPDCSVHTCVTSPPYWGLRDYGAEGQIGLESTPDEYVARMVDVFREVRRVLRDDGTLWLNLGDSYASDTKGGGGMGKSTLGAASGGNGISPEGIDRSQERQQMGTFRSDHGLKQKDLVGIPWRVAFALQADGWWLRSDIIWSKPNPMPESVTDRPTKSHEYVFLLTKSARYFFDADAVREGYKYDGRKVLTRENGEGTHPQHRNGKRDRWPGIGRAHHEARKGVIPNFAGHDESEPMEINHAGRNVRSVWEIATQPYAEAHFATFPQELPRRCIAAGSPAGGVVLDPFMGSGTTALVARNLGRRSVGIELNAEYCELAARRLGQQSLLTGT